MDIQDRDMRDLTAQDLKNTLHDTDTCSTSPSGGGATKMKGLGPCCRAET